MQQAKYELLADGSFLGKIPELPDVWAHWDTLERCRTGLQENLEVWIIDQLYHHHQIPAAIDGISLDPDLVDEQEMTEIEAALEEAKREDTIPIEALKVGLGL